MLEYNKFILEKFMFNGRLFRKEYRKCLRRLSPDDQSAFREWARDRFRRQPAQQEVRPEPELKVQRPAPVLVNNRR